MRNTGYTLQSRIRQRCELQDNICTFKIPAKLHAIFECKIRQYENLENYLIFLIHSSRNLNESNLPNARQLTSCYQEKGLDLQRVDFRIDSYIWHEFKCLARLRGFSMCHFFVILLKMDLANLLTLARKKKVQSVEVPTYKYTNFLYSEEFMQKVSEITKKIGPAPPRKR